MANPSSSSSSSPHRKITSSRSLGLKLIVILVLIVLMAIPIMFISIISFERSSRANDVTRDVSQTYGGEQRLLGPILVIPYRERLANGGVREGDYILSALSGDAVFRNITVTEKSRSLYKVPVYSAEGTLSAQFPDLSDLTLPTNLVLDEDNARIVIGLGDVTGLQADVTLRMGDETIGFEPYGAGQQFDAAASAFKPMQARPIIETVSEGRSALPDVIFDPLSRGELTLLSVPAATVLGNGAQQVTAALSFTGASRLSVTPYAKSTTLKMESDWPHPGFDGRFPPSERSITEDGFSAEWNVPYLRRGLPDQGRAGEMSDLIYGQAGAMQISFVNPLNPYQTVNRALKYAVLFIGLIFLSYFLMETLLRVRVHPAQYLLIGIAQAVFYLLLLAFAEHIGFSLAFLLSAVATVGLTAGYAGAVFGRSLIGVCALVFGSVYALLFVLMRIQDFALMVGALISFIAIAATLYLTRKMDWYGDGA
jgi:inner membrane protein